MSELFIAFVWCVTGFWWGEMWATNRAEKRARRERQPEWQRQLGAQFGQVIDQMRFSHTLVGDSFTTVASGQFSVGSDSYTYEIRREASAVLDLEAE